MYANVLRALHAAGLIPLTDANLAAAQTRADEVLDATAAEFHDLLAPAIDAIWRTDVEGIRTDMRIWLDRLAAVADNWVPMHAELGFGIPMREGLDPASTPDPVVLPDGWQLRGSIDLVEIATTGRQLRIRDYKTGENKTKANLVVGFGRVLQPLLYALAAESLRALPPMEGQLWFATSRSAFTERSVPDVQVSGWAKPWNAKPESRKLSANVPKSHYWATDPHGIDQVGCIYTAQGFEFDYVGVIFGRDLRYDPKTASWVGDKTQSFDAVVKRHTPTS